MNVQGVTIGPGKGGLERILIDRPVASGEIYLQGATVTAWRPKASAKEGVLFVSESALYQSNKAIRGGIPICFPWFGAKAGDPGAPQHGFARTSTWSIEQLTEDATDGAAVIELGLRTNDATRAMWPHAFDARLSVRVGAKLEIELSISNHGETAFVFEEALHTYFTVGDVSAVRVTGLEGADYLDKVDGGALKRQEGEIVIDREIDRLYLGTHAASELRDSSLGRRISVLKDGSMSTVVWNPWIDKARSLKDFGDDEYRRMTCVETVNAASDAITLAPGARHAMRVRIVVNDLV